VTEIDESRRASSQAVAPRRALAVSAGKATRWLSRQLGRGGGTTLPGLVAERLDPRALGDLAAAVPQGCLFVSGTNGKTTSTRILADALQRSGLEPLTNREGSNLLHGLGTTLLVHAGTFGSLRVGERAIGVFEVDEGHLLPAIEAVQPKLVVITNLLRDQLDRYFEIDWVAQLWRKALAALPAESTVVLNADDPQLAHLGEGLPNRVIYYGMEDAEHGQDGLEHTSDSRRCLRCSKDLEYTRVYYAHLGHYRCPHCGWGRPQPSVVARRIALRGMDGSTLEVEGPAGALELDLPLGGLHNAYNALVAVATATAMDVPAEPVRAAVAAARSPFGRLERFTMDGRDVCLALVKNPSGYNETLRLLTSDERPKGLMLAINDQIQDGRDVSWIWDVDFERCRDGVRFIVCAGRRAHDMSVRLKYAGLFEGAGGPELIIEQDVLKAFDVAMARSPGSDPLFVLPTYTAMWTLRETLAAKGHVERFWKS
jgi:lipid II isoglutaminyl synthase (glutamine-hydrolysing)